MSPMADTSALHTPEAKQAASDARSLVKSAEDVFRTLDCGLDRAQARQALARLQEMPESCRRTYAKAIRGRSSAAGIRAFCQMCIGWQGCSVGVRNCTDHACPLYPYRPYRDKDGDG